jgi:hypothetical protein
MARSYRTDKPSAAAVRRANHEGSRPTLVPRIVERKPRQGDEHPLSAHALRNALRDVPVEYLYGLNRIELRARSGRAGDPFAVYWPDEKIIILYSLPPHWIWPGGILGSRVASRMRSFFASLTTTPEGLEVAWPSRACVALWFYAEVLGHELGHHYRHQYRYRRRGARRGEEEIIAMIHSNRFYRRLLRRIRESRAAKRGAA